MRDVETIVQLIYQFSFGDCMINSLIIKTQMNIYKKKNGKYLNCTFVK